MPDKRERPGWVRGRIYRDNGESSVKNLLRELGLNTVCVSAACPNRGECWREKHVTFMILGDRCTRNCRFCNISPGKTGPPDPSEPGNVAEAVKRLGAKYVVLTSVTRDDLEDKGAGQFAGTVRAIKRAAPAVMIELLIPDFGADPSLLERVALSGADVIGHNIEMPEKLYSAIRPEVDYRRSLSVLHSLKRIAPETPVKSSIMIGLGEKEDEISRTLNDLKGAGVDIVYIGQYLNPTDKHWPVKRYYTPQEFDGLKEEALNMGFKAVCAGPMVRSSYRAHQSFLECMSAVGRALSTVDKPLIYSIMGANENHSALQ